MRIRVAILDVDKNYLNRIVSVFTNSFSDKIEIYSFSSMSVAIQSLSENKIDVFLASDNFDINTETIPKRCGFAYFVDSPAIDSVRGKRTICKFQKSEMIYKEILGIFSEHVADSTGISFDSETNTVLCTFVAASGGVGCSTAAVACAKHFALMNKKVLYLNFEQFGTSDLFFSGEGQFDFSDVIFALKSKKSNFALKLESYVKQDSSGVYFYSAAKTALDMNEIKTDDMKKLIADIETIGAYDYIIIDINLSIDKAVWEIFEMSRNIIFVSDGSEVANMKFERAYQALEILEQQNDTSILPRVSLMYNKFSNKTSLGLDCGINILGGVPKYEHASVVEIVEHIKKFDWFEKM